MTHSHGTKGGQRYPKKWLARRKTMRSPKCESWNNRRNLIRDMCTARCHARQESSLCQNNPNTWTLCRHASLMKITSTCNESRWVQWLVPAWWIIGLVSVHGKPCHLTWHHGPTRRSSCANRSDLNRSIEKIRHTPIKINLMRWNATQISPNKTRRRNSRKEWPRRAQNVPKCERYTRARNTKKNPC